MEAMPSDAETHSDENVNNASIQAQLQERARQSAERAQQTGEAHRGFLSRSATPVFDMIFGGLSRISSRAPTPMAQPVPQLAIDLTRDNPPTDDVEMMTAREEAHEVLRSNHPNAHPDYRQC